MFNVLTALAMGIVVFAITIGVGVIVLGKFEAAVADCKTGFHYNSTHEVCCNSSVAAESDCITALGTNYTATSPASTVTKANISELGTSGLAGWAAAIIALAVGLLFIGALMGKRKY